MIMLYVQLFLAFVASLLALFTVNSLFEKIKATDPVFAERVKTFAKAGTEAVIKKLWY